MIRISLKSRETSDAVEIPCDESLHSLCLRATGGKCIVAIQCTRDGLTWGSPVADVRLGSEPTSVKLNLPFSTRAIRAIVENASHTNAFVEIDDSSEIDGKNKASH